MKNISIAIIALVVGLILGSWEQRMELRKAKTKIENLKKELQDIQKIKKRPMVPDVTQMLHVPNPNLTKETSNERQEELPDALQTPVFDPEETDPEELLELSDSPEEMLKTARDLWKVRSAHAEELLREKLELTDQEIEDFRKITDRMNERLKEKIEDFAGQIDDLEEDMTSEMALEIAHDITGILLDTYRDVDDIFPEDWQYQTTEEAELFNFIDPMVALPFMEMEAERFNENQQ